MKLSIVIPTYNIELYIGRCIESVFSQGLDPKEFELIIVNDGTKDNSLSIVEEYKLQYPNIVIYTQKNAGLAATRNKGLTLAKGTYVYFLDGDDYLISNALSQVLAVMEEQDLDVIGFNTMLTASSKDMGLPSPTITIRDKDVVNGYAYIANSSYRNEAWWYMIRTEFLLNLGITFSEGQQLEDSLFTHRLLLNAERFAYTDVSIHRYFQRVDSIIHTREPNLYKQVINDFMLVILGYMPILQDISDAQIEDKLKQKCLQRVQCRQQSFVFFMMIRFLKSNLKYKFLQEVIPQLKKVNAYPMHALLGEEYSGLKYKVVVTMLNSKIGLRISFLLFRSKQKVFR